MKTLLTNLLASIIDNMWSNLLTLATLFMVASCTLLFVVVIGA